jgi:hypothetical protein
LAASNSMHEQTKHITISIVSSIQKPSLNAMFVPKASVEI